jgi:hypothetical protein
LELESIASFVKQRASWFRGYFADPQSPLPSEFIKDVVATVGIAGHVPDEWHARADWARLHMALWLQNVLTDVNHRLDATAFNGYPVWNADIRNPQFFFLADQHFSQLIAWCKQVAAALAGLPPSALPKRRRGGQTKPTTAKRAAFARPLIDKGLTWREIFERYVKTEAGKADKDASPDIMRKAYDRTYPAT